MAGFVVLVWAADRFVLGAAGIARNLGVRPLVIGLTVVGFGTSAPELLVSAMAAGSGAQDMSIGNALGSNIANISMVLGAAALVAPMDVKGTVLRRELPLLVGCMLLATGLMWDGSLDRVDGAILGLALVVMMGWVIRLGLRSENPDVTTEELPDPIPSGHAALWVVVGIALLLGSSRLLVWGASTVALNLGVPNLVVGLSIVAIGTSLPELAASVMAARRGEHELAVGNVIGSNMFNTLGVLSLPGLIRPAPVSDMVLTRDVPAMFGITFLFFLMARFFLTRSVITRFEGAVLVTCFVGYQVAVYITAG
ncbi:MAG: calcium/sodium antiporter [Sandaracinaceae bacterium]